MRANTMRFENCVYADNGLSSLFAFNQIQTNALYVGISANIGTPSTPLEFAAQMSLPYSTRNSLAVTQFIGHAIYDGPTFTLSTHFANFNKPWASAFQAVGAAVKVSAPRHASTGVADARAVSRSCFACADVGSHTARATRLVRSVG